MSGFLPPGLLERLGGLQLAARGLARGATGGVHRSPHRGAGDEFARHRGYEPGDDTRRIDWKLFGRIDRLYVREYRETSSLRTVLVVDASASMGFAEPGGPSKLRYASHAAAGLAHLMLAAGDAVGLIVFGEVVRVAAPPRTRRGQFGEVLRQLESLGPAGVGDAAAALERAGELLRRPGRVVLLGDLLEEDGGDALLAATGRLRARGDETIVLRVLTPAERGEAGAGLFFDPERPGSVVSAHPAADPGFRARVDAYYAGIAEGLQRRGAEYVPLSVAQPVEQALIGWIRGRRG